MSASTSFGLQRPAVRPAASSRRQALRVNALFGKKNATTTVEPEAPAPSSSGKRKENVISQTFNALDFAAPRSKRDAELLYDAKYGERAPDGKMTREQYAALRRKIGGTGKDFFKDWVEEERVENTYYKPDAAGGSVPYLPVLVGIVIAVLATTVVVVQQTSTV